MRTPVQNRHRFRSMKPKGFQDMNREQRIAIAVPPILIGFMYPIFHLLAGAFPDRIAWYIGLVIYWLVWGTAFPLLIIGKESIRTLVQPKKPDKQVLLLVAIPVVLALVVRLFIPGMGYEKESVWIFLLLLSTPFGNGFFEEVLWRGVYLKLFPNSILCRMIWPSFWFAIWHYVPGSVTGGNVAGLMIGAGVMGLYLSYLAKRRNTIWWPIVAHCLGGIIMVV